jgi:hypothetical protein
MRHESSTVIAVVGSLPVGLLAALAESGNLSVVRAAAVEQPGAAGPAAPAGPGGLSRTAGTDGSSAPGALEFANWQPGARALRAASRSRATYVVVANDPLAGVASAWRAMWDVTSGSDSAASFEERAADTLTAWHGKQFELPDYYVVVAPAEGTDIGPDLYLGPLRASRPRRVAVTGVADGAAEAAAPALAANLLDTLRSLEHGPWWPPLDDLLAAARRFYAGGLAESQQARYS